MDGGVALAGVLGAVISAVVTMIVSRDRVDAQEMRHERVARKWLHKNLGRTETWAELDAKLRTLGYDDSEIGEIDEGFRRYVALMAGFRPKNRNDLNNWVRPWVG
jgi:hypothetical protein